MNARRTAPKSLSAGAADGPAAALPVGRYDVFLSHRYADRDRVELLYQRIRDELGYRVYCDWKEHPELDRSKVERSTAEHFRRVMRRCNCLVFYAGPNAQGSKWMPWELGFFDGRQGARRIAVYTDDRAAFEAGEQEYLNLYDIVDAQTLPDFLLTASDDTAAMTSATYDQWQRHAEKLASDPVDYGLSALQWWFGASANLLLDPARMQVEGDGEPTGPLREPAGLLDPWYRALRQQQHELAKWRYQAVEARRHRPGGVPKREASTGAADHGDTPAPGDVTALLKAWPDLLASWWQQAVAAVPMDVGQLAVTQGNAPGMRFADWAQTAARAVADANKR